MKVITFDDILKNDTMDRLTMEESFELFKKKNNLGDDAEISLIEHDYKRFRKELMKVDENEKHAIRIARNAGVKYRADSTFWFDKDGLYLSVNDVPMLKTTGKVHDFFKYEDVLEDRSRDKFFVKNTNYGLLNIPYYKIVSREVKQWRSIGFNDLGLNISNNATQFSISYKQFLNKHFKKELTETLGIIDNNGVNTIGAKRKAYFSTDFKYFDEAEHFVEIMRIEETELVLGKKGVLQLFVNAKSDENWYNKDFYQWHFTSEDKVSQMELVEASDEAFEDVRIKVKSSGVLNFTIKNYPLSICTISNIIHKKEYAEAMALYIMKDYEENAGIYEDEYGHFKQLCKNKHHDIEKIMNAAYKKEYKRNNVLHISNSFSTQSYEYIKKENERFLLSIASESTYFKDNGKFKYALCLGDTGSLSFAIDEKLFEEELKIEVTSFNSDFH